ncbi:MAG: MotA/TolQ/ExbB proton channel family protein [Cyanophyceae cyanobacterium]
MVIVAILVALSIITLTLTVERGWTWGQILTRQPSLVQNFLTTYPQSRHQAIAQLTPAIATFPAARVLLNAAQLERPHPDTLDRALAVAIAAESRDLKRFETWWTTVIMTAPLLGLLGTVTGLMTSFSGLQWTDLELGGDPTVVSEGLGVALESTALGLAIALVALIIAQTCRTLARRQQIQMRIYSLHLSRLYRHHYWNLGIPNRIEQLY